MTRIKVPGTDYEGMTTDQLWQAVAGLSKTRDADKSPMRRSAIQKNIDKVQAIIDRRNRGGASSQI